MNFENKGTFFLPFRQFSKAKISFETTTYQILSLLSKLKVFPVCTYQKIPRIITWYATDVPIANFEDHLYIR